MDELLQIEVARGPREVVIRCSGEIDVTNREQLVKPIREALEGRPPALRIDCSEVRFIAGDGLEVLLDAAVQCRELEIDFRLVASDACRRVIDAAGVSGLLTPGGNHFS